MENSLMRYATREVRPTRADRQLAGTARAIYDEVQVAALQADGVLALGAHIMQGIVGLDARRQALSNGDPVTNAVLGEIEAQTIRDVKRIQASLFSPFGL